MRLLVVEDDTALAATVAAGLRRDGYAVDVTHSGDAAATKPLLPPRLSERSGAIHVASPP